MHLKLISFLLALVFLSSLDYNFYGEISFLEFLQVVVLLTALGVLLRGQELFIPPSNKFSWIVKVAIFLFLIYEELSFLTHGLSDLFTSINNQAEVNLHNAKFLQEVFIYVDIPSFGYSAGIVLHILITACVLFFLSYGSFLTWLKKFDFIFIEKDYAIYSFVYIFSIIFASLNEKGLGSNLLPSLHPEFAELFIYCLLLSDVMVKKARLLAAQKESQL